MNYEKLQFECEIIDVHDKISHYFDRLICQRLYYDAEIA
jgi:hypothetical protein